MNFLAHIYLSPDDEEIILGNFIADAVKGNAIMNFPEKVRKGILLHRMIDEFTDHHPVFIKSRERLLEHYHKFSAVIVDIFYDHFLSANWKVYSNEDIHFFSEKSYGILMKNYEILPSRYRRILPYMIQQNWLVSYSNLDALRRVFEGMSRRTKFKSGMENAVDDLVANYDAFGLEFKEFFPELKSYTETAIVK